VTRKENILFQLYFGEGIMELITFIQIVFHIEDSCSMHLKSTPTMDAASSSEILGPVLQNKGDILESTVRQNPDNFKSRASLIRYQKHSIV
jgi:hypothetical protein